MKAADSRVATFLDVLERKEAELSPALRKLDGIAIEKSADEMDQIQNASEPTWRCATWTAIPSCCAMRESGIATDSRRSFGNCMECETAISSRRLAAVSWALRCIQCRETADRDGLEQAGTSSERLVDAA